MAYIIKNEKDMVGMVNQSIASLRRESEMLILPMLITETPVEARQLLLDVPQFDPRRESDNLHRDAVGIIRVGTVRTIHEALDQLESLSVIDAFEFALVLQCSVGQHIPGKTRRMKTIFGEVIVDLKQYAEVTGLPADGVGATEYSVFLLEVTDQRRGGTRTVLVAVKGRTDTANGNGGMDSALISLLSRLEERAKSGFNTGASFYTRDLQNGWQLLHNKLFREVLGWVRCGYYHLVDIDENRGGLNIGY